MFECGPHNEPRYNTMDVVVDDQGPFDVSVMSKRLRLIVGDARGKGGRGGAERESERERGGEGRGEEGHVY